MDNYNKIFRNKNRILIVTAHPDDAEINAGGLIARLTQDNKLVRVVVATNGINGNKEKLSENKDQFSVARIQSQLEAALALGILEENIINLGIEDGFVETDMKTIKQLVQQIREFKPEIVITHSPQNSIIKYKTGIYWANHRDHRNIAQNVIDAVYPFARDANFFPDFIAQNVLPHTVEDLLFFEQFDSENEQFIDITSFLEVKSRALSKHKINEVLSDKDIEVFTSENKINNRFYERFGHVVINRLNTLN